MYCTKQTKYKWIGLLTIAVLVGIDQLAKYFALVYLKPVSYSEFIRPIINFQWATNTGAAYSSFDGNTLILIGVTSLIILAGIGLILFNKFNDPFLVLNVSVILGGGLGNLVDRIFRGGELFHGYVIDYLKFAFIEFPIFNFADICVTVGAVVLCVYILFFQEKRKARLEAVMPKYASADTASEKKKETDQTP